MIAPRRSKVQTQRDVLAGKSPAIQLNVNATRMSQASAGSSYIQQAVPRQRRTAGGSGAARASPPTWSNRGSAR